MENQTVQDPIENYIAKRQAVVEQLRQINSQAPGSGVALSKPNSNLFRARQQASTQRLNVRSLNQVIKVDAKTLTAEVEGMTTYETFVAATLKFNLLPTVVPELKTITVGGAIAGGGIEASSFKYGLVHETVLEIEVLLSDGQVVVATPTNQYSDLFFGLPNTFGTLGYVLKAKLKLIPAKPFVQLNHVPFTESIKLFATVTEIAASGQYDGHPVDFMDGTVFKHNQLYLTLGRFFDQAPQLSDYKYMRQYYRSIPELKTDYLTAGDFIWRWDTDWFWCSKNFGVENPLLRRLFGPKRLGSKTYWQILKWDGRWHLGDKLNRLTGQAPREAVIQDVQIPVEHAVEFLDFFDKEIGISPVWVCPTQPYDAAATFPFYPLKADNVYINFGFWDTVAAKGDPAKGHFNRLIEQKVTVLGGKKGLYSDSFYTPDEFWQLYDKPAYDSLKSKYDAQDRFKNLYTKTVKRG